MNRFSFVFVRALIVSVALTLLPSCSSNDPSGSGNNDGVEQHEVVIVGGGISGLTCGYYLGKRDFVILEKSDVVGGRTVSGTYNNVTYALGTEYLGQPEDHLADLVSKLGLSPVEIPEPMDAFFDGTKIYYGADAEDQYLIDHSSVATFNKFVSTLLADNNKYDDIPDLNYNSWARGMDEMTARQWFLNNGFPIVYINKYNVESRGIFGASLDEISALCLIPEASFDYDESDLQNNRMPQSTMATKDQGDQSNSYTFLRGITEVTEKLGQVLNNKIKLNSTVSLIEKKGDLYRVTYTDKNGAVNVMDAKRVVLAVPAPIALQIAPDIISKERADIMKDISYSSYATVALFSKTAIFNKAFDLAVPDGYFFTDVYDATWVQRHYDKSFDPNTFIATVYIAPQTYKDHSLDNMSDNELLQKVYADLDKVLPGASKKVSGYKVHHFPYAYPVMTLGAYGRLIKLNDMNTGSLILAGDYMIYPTFESAVETGYYAAEAIMDNE